MKKLFSLIAALISITAAQAQSLGFYLGVLSNNTNVTLYLSGPTAYSNRTCVVEGLNPYNQTWQSLGTVMLNSNGLGSFNTTLNNGVYGFYRAKTTNGVFLSTNAFGAVTGTLAPGYSLIGNPFGMQNLYQIFPQPPEDEVVYKWNNASSNYVSTAYSFGQWDANMNVGQCEGILVKTPTNTWIRFVFSGLFDANTLSLTIPAGSSIICSPMYQIVDGTPWRVDNLTTNRLGGLSALPVQSSYYNPQCTINRMINSSGTYQQYTLTSTNGNWLANGIPSTVPLNLAEGFWISKPTNATWNVSRSIW